MSCITGFTIFKRERYIMNKKNVYHVTLHWYVESDVKLTPRSQETDERILDVLRHRINGTPSCSSCPTRTPDNYTIVKSYDTDPDNKIYMSIDRIVQQNK